MNYASVCSGAEAFGKPWEAMGFESVFHAEIEQHAAAVLRCHYPNIPNHGDFTTINGNSGLIQLLIGGTPCQSFSIAGLRGGMEDARGNLTLGFCKLAAQLQPKWVLWENVPGVLSSNGGRDFGSFLGGLAQLGYGFAYRVLDAQYFGVPQRRKRAFVVGCLGDWRSAAAVLFERHSLQGHPTPRREKGERIADSLTVGANQCSGFPGDFVEDKWPVRVAPTLNACFGTKQGLEDQHALNGAGLFVPGIAGTINTRTSRSTGADDAANGHLIVFDTTQITSPENGSNPRSGDPCHSLNKNAHAPTIAFKVRGGCEGGGKGYLGDDSTAFTVTNGADQQLYHQHAVRRLMPIECERLQGWDDDWTRYGVNAKGKHYELSDSARYKIIGNGWAVPVVNWIANRIKTVDQQSLF